MFFNIQKDKEFFVKYMDNPLAMVTINKNLVQDVDNFDG